MFDMRWVSQQLLRAAREDDAFVVSLMQLRWADAGLWSPDRGRDKTMGAQVSKRKQQRTCEMSGC